MPVVTVAQLNNYMKRYIDQNVHLSNLWIKGEISNFKQHYSGHIYLTLKDETSTLKAVMFKHNSSGLHLNLRDGMKVIAFGKIGVYEPSGTYQLYIDSVIPDGKGELYAAYEQLKEKLQFEGLFDIEYKKPIPKFPKRIGIVSSISGAAIRDILNVISRRYKNVDLIIYPAKVQGIGSSESICDGLRYFSECKNVDVIIVARGGGSIEDLWSFNEEKTARAIFECTIPIISGVGHETDFTISDFVADMRAPTPSAAAEIATPSEQDLKNHIDNFKKQLYSGIQSVLERAKRKLERNDNKKIYLMLKQNLTENIHKSEKLRERISTNFSNRYRYLSEKMISLSSTLDALSPYKILNRGYTYVVNPDDSMVDFSKIAPDDSINVIFAEGRIECLVRRVIYDKKE